MKYLFMLQHEYFNMQLENITISERSQSQNFMIPLNMNYPEQSNPQRQKRGYWLPGDDMMKKF